MTKTKNDSYINCFSECIGNVRCHILRETQECFGDRCNLSQKTISRIENLTRRRMVSLSSICNISRGLGIYPSQLLAMAEKELASEDPGSARDFQSCLIKFDETTPSPDISTITDILQVIQAALSLRSLMRNKSIIEITREDIDPIYGFFIKNNLTE